MGPSVRFPLATVVLLQMLAGAVLAADIDYFGITPYQPVVLQGAIVRLQANGNFNDDTTARLTSATLSSGGNHTCAVIANGEVRCWGRNGSGQLGNGTTTDSAQPVAATVLVTATAVAAGGEFSCVLQADGVSRCWGRNAEGQLGNGTTAASSTPVTVTGVTAKTLAAGFQHACALLASGAVSCWGANNAGQLGNGSVVGATTAVSVTGITTAVAIATGGSHSCAVLAAGGVKCWGADAAGQLGNGAGGASTVPVDVTGITTAVGITAGFDHTCALLANGTVRCWGRGLEGQLGNGGMVNSTTPVSPSGIQLRIVALGAGLSHTCVVLENGLSVCWGDNSNGQVGNGAVVGTVPLPISVVELGGTIAVSAGFAHSCALLIEGDVKCWGLNDGGQLGMGTAGGAVQRSGIPLKVNGPTLAINAGGNHTCVTTPSGTVSCWGHGLYGQLGNGGIADSPLPAKVVNTDQAPGTAVNVTRVGLGFQHTCGIYADGDAKCWGRNDAVQLGTGIASPPPQVETPTDVYQMSSAMAVASGSAHSCVVLFNGQVQCWGNNNFRQTGYDQPASPNFPATVPGITTALNVSAGFEHTCAVLSTGTVQCWGRGDQGQLGNGATANSAAPVTVTGITTATAVSLGDFHSCARLVGGALRCWGRNAEGQLGDGTTTQSSVPVGVSGITNGSVVTAGSQHTCARLSTGEGRCWGRGLLGQLGNGLFPSLSTVPVVVTGLAGAVNMDAGMAHTCAGLVNGRIQCWGYNELGQLGNGLTGTGSSSATPVTVNGINIDAAGLSYTSDDPSVATVDNAGNVRAVNLGTTTIRARYDSKQTATTFTVAIDTDGDTVPDPIDNCTLVPNPGQCDSDADGFGNHCDGDLNNNDFTNAQDTTLFRAQLGLPSNPPLYNEADLNCNGFVNSQDTTLFRQLLGRPAGPAGVIHN